VRINLVPRIPDQSIFGKVINQMQRNTKLHDTQIAGKVGRTVRNDRQQSFPDFISKARKVGITKSAQVSGGSDSAEEFE
jgi:hypothetical protein